MKITYIHHSAFLAETESACLLFDYFEGELPEIPKNKPLYILASHNHHDHFSEAVFSLAKHPSSVTYLLSWDIPVERVPEDLRSITHFLQPQKSWTDGLLALETFRSTDEGVAFWCTLDGKHLYHAGDLNHWYWEGEDPDWNKKMTADYKKEMEYLEGKHIDLAFTVLDPRQEKDYALGMNYFMEHTHTKHVFPMHFWNDFTIMEKYLQEHSVPNHTSFYVLEQNGQQFQIML